MRILHIINNLGSGGAEKLLEQSLPLINKFEEYESQVLLLTDNKNVFDKKLIENNVKIDVVPLKNIFNPLNIYYVRKYIINGKFDVVHAHLFPTNYWTALTSKIIFSNKPRFILTEHSTHNSRRGKWYLRQFEKFLYTSFDKVVSISQKTQENLIDWINPIQNNIGRFIVIENGVDIEKFINAKPYKKSEMHGEFTKETKLICMIGRFAKTKDHNTLIKAMLNLPPNIHLLLVGEGPLKTQSMALAEEIGVENKVHFLDFRSDVEKVLKTSDLTVISSHWEGFGLAAVEGMAAGKPIIASDVPGLREVVNGAGILFEKGNHEELSVKMRELLTNQDVYALISKQCFERANQFSLEKMVAAYIKMYKDLLN